MDRPTLIISDNHLVFSRFLELCNELNLEQARFRFFYSSGNKAFEEKLSQFHPTEIKPLSVEASVDHILKEYSLVISIHCKQLFPKKLVKGIRCVNVHPGYNPTGRGWYPQIFAIVEGYPAGATIHEIDEQLDHGRIISREMIKIHSWDTSLSLYNRVLELEMKLLRDSLPSILSGRYNAAVPDEEGVLRLKKDFYHLCKLDLNEHLTMGQAIDKLRALTHGQYKNAYFIDPEGNVIFVRIELEKD